MVPFVKPLEVVEHYASVFKDVFIERELSQLKKYLSGLLISPNKTVEGINRLFVLDVQHQSTLNRFLTDSKFDVEALNRCRVKWLQECPEMTFKKGEDRKGVLILDDTLLTHYGPHFEKAGYLYDHVNNNYTWAHCLLNLHYSDDQTDYPINFRMWAPAQAEVIEAALSAIDFRFKPERLAQKESSPSEWRRYLMQAYRYQWSKPEEKRKGLADVHQSKITLAKELLDNFIEEYPDTDLPISFDSWYTCAELCQHIDQKLKRAYVGTLKENDCILIGANQTKVTCSAFAAELVQKHRDAVANGEKGFFEKTGIHYKGKKEHYWVYCDKHNINKLGKQRLVIAFSQEDLSSTPCFYISNRMHWRGGGILRIRRHRWPIEVYHEEGKAEGLDQYQIRQFDAIIKHVACVALSYSMLKRVQYDDTLLNKLSWKPAEVCTSLAFWRRVMTADALLALFEWACGRKAEDNPRLLQAIAQVVQAQT
jgi:DDE superfamily endonuclease